MVGLPEMSFFEKNMTKWEQSATAPCKKNINDLHVELGHASDSIGYATTKTLGMQVIGTFKPFEDCALSKANQ